MSGRNALPTGAPLPQRGLQRRAAGICRAALADEITDALNGVVADVGGTIDPFVSQAARRILESTEW